MKQVWKYIRKDQCFCNFCATKVNDNLEITSVRSSLDLGNKFELENHLSTLIDIFIFATRKLWNYLVQVFLVGFSSFLLFDYTSLMSEEMMRIIGKLGLRHSKNCENQKKGRTKKTMLKWGKSCENFWCNLEPRNFHITEK